MADFEEFKAGFLAALRREPTHDHEQGIDFKHYRPASANKHLLGNAAAGLIAYDRHDASGLVEFFDWLEWYAHHETLHANEATTPSESYRTAIDYPTWVCAGLAQATGRAELAGKLFARSRASLAHLALGVGTRPPRKVRDHGTPGTVFVLWGDGEPDPVPGSGGGVPFVAQAGQRGKVRAADNVIPGGTKFDGKFHYTNAWALSVMLGQPLGWPYKEETFKLEAQAWEAIRRRWPAIPVWGLSATDLATLRSFVGHPTDVRLARSVWQWACACPPSEGRLYVRHVDGGVEAVAVELGDSSTDGVAVRQAWADGRTALAGASSGSRNQQEIARQMVNVDGEDWLCSIPSTGASLRIQRMRAPEAWSALIGPSCGFSSPEDVAPDPPAPPKPTPKPPKKKASWIERMGL